VITSAVDHEEELKSADMTAFQECANDDSSIMKYSQRQSSFIEESSYIKNRK
jgi:hypothetical protein